MRISSIVCILILIFPFSKAQQDIEGSGENEFEVLSVENSTLKTTSTPSPVRCFDQSFRCSRLEHLCKSSLYRNLMIRGCAKTCGLCHEFVQLPRHERCRDSWTSCSKWVSNGYCHSSFYTLTERTVYCAKSCGFC